VSGAAYAWGLSSLWIFPSCVGGFLINWYLLAPSLQRLSRKRNALTVTEVLAGPPGTPLRQPIATVASVIILLSLGTYVASQFQGAGKTFSETFEISLSSSILLGSGIVILYTLLGGFWAVSVTDTLQGLLMALTSIMLPTAALIVVGGPTRLIDGLSAIQDPGFLSLTQDLPFAAGIGFLLGLLGIGLGYPGQPHVVNRFMALKDEAGVLRRARRIAIAWALVVYSGMLLLGLCGRILLPSLNDPELVFVSLTNSLFSPVISGVMLAAVLSAIMSTADSQLLVAGSTVTNDLNLGGRDTAGMLRRSRAVIFLLSAAATVAALYGSKEIFSQVLFAWAAMGSAFGPILLVTVLKGEIEPRIKLIAMLTGCLLSIGSFYLVPSTLAWKGGLERFVPFVIGLMIALYGWLKLRSELRVTS
jgi:sodium/proline symporter